MVGVEGGRRRESEMDRRGADGIEEVKEGVGTGKESRDDCVRRFDSMMA